MASRNRVTVNLSDDDASWLRAYAEDHGASLSVSVQTMIAARRADLIRAELRSARRLESVAMQLCLFDAMPLFPGIH